MSEAILSGSLQWLSNMLVSPAIEEFARIYGVKDELQRLRGTLDVLQALLRDAERRQIEEQSLEVFLRQLGTVTRIAEDVMDEFEYEYLKRSRIEASSQKKRRVEGSSQKTCVGQLEGHDENQAAGLWIINKVRQILYPLNPPQLLFRHDMAGRIREINEKLDDIRRNESFLQVVNQLGKGENKIEVLKKKRSYTTSFLKDTPIFGREREKEDIIQFLLASNRGESSSSSWSSSSSSNVRGTNLPVLVIVGMGGLGKTTLAQQVYNDNKLKTHFHEKMWVCTSNNFDINSLTKQIYEHVVKPGHDIKSLNVIQVDLKEKLKGKRFLLVIDDVWDNVDHTKWDELCAPFSHGEKGSRVIVTTRFKKVANITRSVKTIELPNLHFDDSWLIFKYCANIDETLGANLGLVEIGRKIVEKLKGNPLAASTIGSLLCDELNERRWTTISTSEMWELEQPDDGILPALKLSYLCLPTHLKQCFIYCSLFPKGYQFKVPDLVKLWMAQGFIQKQQSQRVEDIGREYFDDLLCRSFFQFVNGSYVIHDLLHDLAQFVSKHEYITVAVINELQDEIETNHDEVFHLRLMSGRTNLRNLGKLDKFKSLRSLFFSIKYGVEFQDLHNLFDKCKCLRVLSLCECDIESVPDSIGNLKHLRYLDLSCNKMVELPESLCCLYHLQTLKLNACFQLHMLPEGTSNLVNLRHLEVRAELFSKVIGIGKLIYLQKIYVTFDISHSNARGLKIEDLKDMNELGGELHIRNLERVNS